jgi:hypothetical protein
MFSHYCIPIFLSSGPPKYQMLISKAEDQYRMPRRVGIRQIKQGQVIRPNGYPMHR